ncbi:MAG TPA: methylated-DNA--[protein]-cysteine S-methyltransferase, partial [Prosthecobacter sp.]|nr:methylated-DNA--[protein]-cysteine S-methyltransferase [Prosthecobacter sp.]
MKTNIYFTETDSPLGRMVLAATEQGLCGVYFHDQRYLPEGRGTWVRDDGRFAGIIRHLEEYFSGKTAALETTFDFVQGTPFQRAVWEALRQIPLGRTWTYGQLAARLGKETAVRAVGAAVGRNPLSIVVPCHRVIGASGGLTGYAGGLERKRWLLG